MLDSFPGGSDSKEFAYNAGDPGSTPGLGRCPGERNGWQPTSVLPGAFPGQRSLVGYSPGGHVFQEQIQQGTRFVFKELVFQCSQLSVIT